MMVHTENGGPEVKQVDWVIVSMDDEETQYLEFTRGGIKLVGIKKYSIETTGDILMMRVEE